MNLPDLLSPVVGEPVSLAFSLLLVFHVFSGLTCVLAGGVAIASRKRRGRHPRFGDVYYWSLSVVFASATGLAGLRWERSLRRSQRWRARDAARRAQNCAPNP